MLTPLNILAATRQNVLAIVEPFSVEQMNHIPPGFSNHLAWQIGHILVTQQQLCYSLSGLSGYVPMEYLKAYQRGSKPQGTVSEDEIQTIKTMLVDSVELLKNDIEAQKFLDYQTFKTGFGVSVNNVEEAILFNNSHEAMHLGYMLSIRKFL